MKMKKMKKKKKNMKKFKKIIKKVIHEYPDIPPENYRQRSTIKQEILIKLIRLDKAGYSPSKKFTMATSYEDLLFEYRRLKRQRDIEKVLNFQER